MQSREESGGTAWQQTKHGPAVYTGSQNGKPRFGVY